MGPPSSAQQGASAVGSSSERIRNEPFRFVWVATTHALRTPCVLCLSIALYKVETTRSQLHG